jgi:hypothetical protein
MAGCTAEVSWSLGVPLPMSGVIANPVTTEARCEPVHGTA